MRDRRAEPARGVLAALARNRPAFAAAIVLAGLYLAAAFAPFLAPYGEAEIDREHFRQPPTPVHLFDDRAAWRFAPHVHATAPAAEGSGAFVTLAAPVRPLRLLPHGAPWRCFGLVPCDRHLFGVDAPDRVHLLGADPLGRDEFTRLLFGAQVSLGVALAGVLVSFAFGLLLGGLAGYLGGWVDVLVMRGAEVLLALPGLYLVLALRGAFPPGALPGRATYLVVVLVLAVAGWGALARVVRGMARSIRASDHVLAAEALGAGRWRVLVRHVLPGTASYAIVAATLAVPGYILGEAVLSYIGMGVQEPAASWGNMLQQARALDTLGGSPWLLFCPAAAMFVTVMAFNTLGDGLRDALDPRRVTGKAR